jgi:hypothetical protein
VGEGVAERKIETILRGGILQFLISEGIVIVIK